MRKINWRQLRDALCKASAILVDDQESVYIDYPEDRQHSDLISLTGVDDDAVKYIIKKEDNMRVEVDDSRVFVTPSPMINPEPMELSLYRSWNVSSDPEVVGLLDFDERWKSIQEEVKKVAAWAGIAINRGGREKNKILMDAHQEVRRLCAGAGLKLFSAPNLQVLGGLDTDRMLLHWEQCSRFASADQPEVEAEVYDGTKDLLRINAPAWYRHEGFLAWLNSDRAATWHIQGRSPGEGSDAFFTFCDGDGSDAPMPGGEPGLPEEIWEYLSFLVADTFGWDSEVLVWVSNFEE